MLPEAAIPAGLIAANYNRCICESAGLSPLGQSPRDRGMSNFVGSGLLLPLPCQTQRFGDLLGICSATKWPHARVGDLIPRK